MHMLFTDDHDPGAFAAAVDREAAGHAAVGPRFAVAPVLVHVGSAGRRGNRNETAHISTEPGFIFKSDQCLLEKPNNKKCTEDTVPHVRHAVNRGGVGERGRGRTVRVGEATRARLRRSDPRPLPRTKSIPTRR